MGYPDAAWERAMRVQDVILRALSGEMHWFRAAEIGRLLCLKLTMPSEKHRS